MTSVFATTDSFAVVGTGNEPDLLALDGSGGRRVFHRGTRPPAMTDDDVNEIMAAKAEESGQPDVVEASVRIAGRPAALPPYNGLVAADDGRAVVGRLSGPATAFAPVEGD